MDLTSAALICPHGMVLGHRGSFVLIDPENSVLLFSLNTVIVLPTKSMKYINIE
jgi:hypothetical protein